MNAEDFPGYVDVMAARIKKLFEQKEQQSSDENPLMQQALEEIGTLIEELQVASEELVQQNQELRNAQDVIEAGKKRYADLFNFAPDGYLVTDENGLIRESNLAANEMLGVMPEYLQGKPIANYVALETRSDFRKRLAQLVASGEGVEQRTETWEVRLQPKSKEVIYASIRVALMPAEAGPEGGSVWWILHDVTRQKAIEAELRQAKDELELRVAERTQELSQANDELRALTEQLERRNQVLQDFAFVASHDLKEPLRKVISFGERLKANSFQALGEEGRDYLQRMINATSRMQGMINGLLEYAQTMMGEKRTTPVDLALVAREVVSDLESRIQRSKGQVIIHSLPTIQADPVQMRQLLQNLIANGLKFHKAGEAPQVEVWSEVGELVDRVQILVRDQGIGIDPRYLDWIFQPFHRVERDKQFEGTGMGLAICQQIVERHRGQISAHSSPGEGTTIVVTLPYS